MAAPSASATQQFVPIKEIRNGIIVLKDGSYRGILICSSINFGLKSADEQHAITLGFQNFLNTLDFSIQIVVNSRKMDLRPYLALLEEKAPDKLQIHESSGNYQQEADLVLAPPSGPSRHLVEFGALQRVEFAAVEEI